MTNIMQSSSQWLAEQFDAHMSIDVIYRRGDVDTPIKVTKGRSQFELVDANNMLIAVQSHDFLTTAASLLVLPVEGFQLIETINGKQLAYEVNNFGNELPYRNCDHFGIKIRIHTKFIGEVST